MCTDFKDSHRALGHTWDALFVVIESIFFTARVCVSPTCPSRLPLSNYCNFIRRETQAVSSWYGAYDTFSMCDAYVVSMMFGVWFPGMYVVSAHRRVRHVQHV